MSARQKKRRPFKKRRTSTKKSPGAAKNAIGSATINETGSPRDWYPFRQLRNTENQRRREIEVIFRDEFAFIDDCLALAARQVELLGGERPVGIRDVAMRDLSCDAFEFLYEARNVIAENRSSIAFPAMRRAFESISLCHLFTVKPEYSERWAKGIMLSSAEVRKQLENAPLTESVDQLRSLYKHFSQGTHPNRSHIPFLFLGEGNKFTLGAIHPVDPLNLGGHILHLMSLCYWYAGIFLYFYGQSIVPKLSAKFKRAVLDLTPRSDELQRNLRKALDELRKNKEERPPGIGPTYLEQSN